jgi:hypothetical protein
MAKPKLHEVLAVEASLLATSVKLTKETQRTLGKTNLFSGQTKRHEVFDDTQQHLVQATEEMKVETSVAEVMFYFLDAGFAPYIDAVLQKDATNQIAKADIVIDGNVIASDVPGTTLLGLESKIAGLFPVFDAIPTLEPGVRWSLAPSEGANVYVNPVDEERVQTKRIVETKVIVAPTEFHPAQIRDIDSEVKTGKFIVTKYSSMLSSIEKADLLVRLQKLHSAVKQARQRANHAEVPDVHIGKTITAYLLG